MASQAVKVISSEAKRPDGRADVTLTLLCGCQITRTLDEHRLITADDGTRLAVGKYPCPLGHPVRGP